MSKSKLITEKPSFFFLSFFETLERRAQEVAFEEIDLDRLCHF